MNYFKINLSIFLLSLILLTPVQSVRADTIDYYNVDIKLFENNTAEITETIYYNFSESNRHGIYRQIPESFKANGNLSPIDIKIKSITNEEGKPYKFVNQSFSGIDLKIGDPDKYVDSKEIYVIKYLVKNPIGFFENNDEFYWNLTGNDWVVSTISNVHAKIEFPETIEGRIGSYNYCGLIGSNSSCGSFFVSGHVVRFDSYKVFNSGEGVTIDLEFDKGIISEPTVLDNIIGMIWKYLPVLVAFILAILIFIKVFKVQIETTRLYKKFKSSHPDMVQYTPEKFSVIEASFFHDGKSIPSKDVAGFIVWCAIEGYIKIIEDDGDYCFDKLDGFNKLENDTEKDFINQLSKIRIKKEIGFSRVVDRNEDRNSNLLKSTISSVIIKQVMKSFTSSLFNMYVNKILENDYIHSETLKKIEKKIEKSLKLGINSQLMNYFDFINAKKYGLISLLLFLSLNPGLFFLFFSLSLGLGLIGLIPSLILIFMVIFILFFIKAMPDYTEKGMEAAWFIKGLYKYINMSEKERIKVANSPEKTPVLFEKLLPYAMVFGLEEKWIREFEGIYQISNSYWISSNSSAALNLSLISKLSISIDNSIGKSIAPKSSSGGFSGGGGSSGGGGGGGGGGSW